MTRHGADTPPALGELRRLRRASASADGADGAPLERSSGLLSDTPEMLMAETAKWRDGVTVVRAQALDATMRAPSGPGRATAFDFAGSGGQRTWIGTATLTPSAKTGAHHHGRHEVAIYVIRGRSEIRWGARLEFAAHVAAGDFVYFTPYVPHQELNLSDREAVDFLVVRSDNERIAVALDVVPVERPETVC